MCRILPLIACLLAVLWLPATSHCGLEAAGLIDHAASLQDEACCAVSDEACAQDSCKNVESGITKPSATPMKLSAETAVVLSVFLLAGAGLFADDSGEAPPLPAFEKPLDWLPDRHFARRAAPLSRAPSPVC